MNSPTKPKRNPGKEGRLDRIESRITRLEDILNSPYDPDVSATEVLDPDVSATEVLDPDLSGADVSATEALDPDVPFKPVLLNYTPNPITKEEDLVTESSNNLPELFTNMSDVKRVVLSDMVLKTVLFASLFFLLTHKDMQPVLKKLVKNLPKSVGKVLHPAVLFGMLYYLLELFI